MSGAGRTFRPVDPSSDEAVEVRRDFDRLVNMTAHQLERWLATDESLAVGQKAGGESVGHASGRRIVAILDKRKGDLTADDLGHMKKVAGYIKRHLAQRPDGSKADIEHSDWASSLRNWGHDPLK